MANYLHHVTSPQAAHHILSSGVFEPFSHDVLCADACLNMLLLDADGERLPQAGQQQIFGGYGVVLGLKWEGPVETLGSWSDSPSANVLYHQPWNQLSAASVLEPDAYYRSLVRTGTNQHLSITEIRVDPDVMAEEWVKGSLPKGLMGAWRFIPAVVRQLFRARGASQAAQALSRLVGSHGRLLIVSGPA
ncbi:MULTISPECIES: hypothetical protein [unclassified Halomonas]|uniref:hypothetical protein n=1 Tax=unclassified Halomonas TaxID=2609666 RepID=UPI0005577F93|nr:MULTISPECIES: hypothetical protein [unclassified Halomonas]CEP35321.1 Putative uncharacterized protein [Halomonas sp. R57-5]